MPRWIVVVWVLIACAAIIVGYVRLAPSDPARWHVLPEASEDTDLPNGVVRVVMPGPDGLARLDAIAKATPRTVVLAGSVAEGQVTYVTRSELLGYPDYTTVLQDGDHLVIFARSRFGRSDMGVNRDRVGGWLAQLKP